MGPSVTVGLPVARARWTGSAWVGRAEDQVADALARGAQLPLAGQLGPPGAPQVAPRLGQPVEADGAHVLARPRRAAVLVEVGARLTLRGPDRPQHVAHVIRLVGHRRPSLRSGRLAGCPPPL